MISLAIKIQLVLGLDIEDNIIFPFANAHIQTEVGQCMLAVDADVGMLIGWEELVDWRSQITETFKFAAKSHYVS